MRRAPLRAPGLELTVRSVAEAEGSEALALATHHRAHYDTHNHGVPEVTSQWGRCG